MRDRFVEWARCEKGATVVEYGLIAALMTIALIGSLTQLNGSSSGMWKMNQDEITGAMTP